MKIYSKNLKIVFCSFAIYFCFLNISFAETIVLKSGKTIEGKIINKTDEYIEVDFMGVKLKYFNDQIAQIKETKSATTSSLPAEPDLISIKIKGTSGSTENPKKIEETTEFIIQLDGINNKMDSVTSERIGLVLDPRWQKMTANQRESMNNVIKAMKEKIAEVEKLKPPSSCKMLREILLKKGKARIKGVEEILQNSPPLKEIERILDRQNREVSEISKKYNEEKQRILKESGITQ